MKKMDSTDPLHPGFSYCNDPGQETRRNVVFHQGKCSLTRQLCPSENEKLTEEGNY